ncbi:MAG TPA: hypothetical protein VM469_08195, partial [Pseudoxanthomonas sp.]|nr:hypothetical protein [Pseudoxanthomonas sp.]
MRHRRLAYWTGATLLGGMLSSVAGLWWLGGELVAPHPATIGQAPADLHAASVRIALNDEQWIS